MILAKLSNVEQQHKDNASVISRLTDMSKLNALQQSQTNSLQGLLAQMQKQCMSAEESSGPPGGTTGFQGAGESTGSKRQVMTWFGKLKTIVKYNPNKRRSSDGNPSKMKETKYYKNSNDYCWSCGWDVTKGYNGKTCWTQAKGHQKEATPQNLMNTSMKDFDFSISIRNEGVGSDKDFHYVIKEKRT